MNGCSKLGQRTFGDRNETEVAFPELEGQPFIGILKDIFKTGETYAAKEDRVDLIIDGIRQTFYYNFSYKPLKNPNGELYAVLNMAVNVAAW